MKELREEKLRKDEEKLMNAIHNQYRNARLDYSLNKGIKEISKMESLKKTNKIKTIALIIAIVTLIVLGIKYNEIEISNCMESGKSETFCRYAGE